MSVPCSLLRHRAGHGIDVRLLESRLHGLDVAARRHDHVGRRARPAGKLCGEQVSASTDSTDVR